MQLESRKVEPYIIVNAEEADLHWATVKALGLPLDSTPYEVLQQLRDVAAVTRSIVHSAEYDDLAPFSKAYALKKEAEAMIRDREAQAQLPHRPEIRDNRWYPRKLTMLPDSEFLPVQDQRVAVVPNRGHVIYAPSSLPVTINAQTFIRMGDVNTGGGAYIEGSVTAGGNVTGRDVFCCSY